METDCINRNVAIHEIIVGQWIEKIIKNQCTVRDMIAAIPAADVRPVVHGEWIVDSIASNIFSCSICGQDAPVEPTGGTEYKSNFCPNCGADMRPEEAHNE